MMRVIDLLLAYSKVISRGMGHGREENHKEICTTGALRNVSIDTHGSKAVLKYHLQYFSHSLCHGLAGCGAISPTSGSIKATRESITLEREESIQQL